MQMKRLLFIGPDSHEITGSSQFMRELLCSKYLTTCLSINLVKGNENVHLEGYFGERYDVLVCWQVMLPASVLRRIDYSRGVFFPMYDGCPSVYKIDRWLPYREFQIVSFCRKLHEDLLRVGLSSHYIQYYPKPIELADWGDEARIFFWRRRQAVGVSLIETLFSSIEIQALHLHDALDSGMTAELPVLKNGWTLTVSTWYEQKLEMINDMQMAAYYVAPREREGIGMSFLEAMAAGRCVVGVDEPTMNEYIIHGHNGLLYSPGQPVAFEQFDLRELQKQAREDSLRGRRGWEDKQAQIFEWINEVPRMNLVRIFARLLIRFLSSPITVSKSIFRMF